MKDRSVIGTISFPTRSACAVWRAEILGQMSDGMWENTSPGDHWVFWHRLRTVVDCGKPAAVTMDEGKFAPYNQKTSYGIASLYEIIGDRMVAYGRMGRTLSTVVDIDVPGSPDWETRYGKDSSFDACLRAAEYMEQLGLEKFLSGDWDKQDNYQATYLRKVDEETARRFFATKYDIKDLKQDVKLIKQALKSLAK